ncbi:MAG: ABC transporter ATP-binding protein [Azospirillaceae bacterium]
MTPVLDIRGLHLAIGNRRRATPILRGVGLKIGVGEVHGLVGESGAGKSMVGRALLDILPGGAVIAEGRIDFLGRDMIRLSERERRRLLGREISLIPQDPMTALNPVRRIGAQVADVLRLHLGLKDKAVQARVVDLLDGVHIREPERVARRYPHELSGGMRQRVLIATAFACEPKLIVADEPTTALDVTVQRQILRLIRDMQARHGTAILFITHDLGVVAKICGEVSVIQGGRILEHGTAEAIFSRPAHPYTRALIAATPRYDRPGDRLQPVPTALLADLAREALELDARRPGATSAP